MGTVPHVEPAPPPADIARLLAYAVEHHASDLHLSAGLAPRIRVHGDVVEIDMAPLPHMRLQSMVHGIMNDNQRQQFTDCLETDFSFVVPGLARFRVNVFMQNRGCAAVFRAIPSVVPSLDELAAPSVFREIAARRHGLILVTGPTGCGKSTTVAAMVDDINASAASHIVTIEDPIEFVHESKRSLVNQREVHNHTRSFAAALRSALREDPDVILIGELRDLETIRLALTAAETGHLVLATLHTSSAAKTVDRIVEVFPGAEKAVVRGMLAESLRAVIAQTLLRRRGGGRIAAHEVMLATPAIRNLIREGKVAQMYSVIQTGRAQGMWTLEQNVRELIGKGLIASDTAPSRSEGLAVGNRR